MTVIPQYRGERPDPVAYVTEHLSNIETVLASGRVGLAHDLLKKLIAALNRETR